MQTPEPYGEAMKSKGGLNRIVKALRYTWDGLCAAVSTRKRSNRNSAW